MITTPADVRALLRHLPADHRHIPQWGAGVGDGAAEFGGKIFRGAEAAACGNAGCPGLSTRQVRIPFSSLQTGQMWPLGHCFASCACATTHRAETMSATTVRRMTAMHGLRCAITPVDNDGHAARGRRRFPPPWTVEDHNRALLHCEGSRRPRACIRLLRRRSRQAIKQGAANANDLDALKTAAEIVATIHS